ncbi:thiamine-phosphate synthase [Adhaeribacter aerolatus]|uniref:Thiamine-phosphate synthase n=1 Tax=Adhaeribacter aerolatus TaxID=670289 RepID=A0A512B677_9BACT|nr:thiamine phosphate synthase [Adhaeribacter aerolatus]GEO07464.1 thiamine-phosphate synthase [Adhaeribacter aerolatus]
MISRLHYITQEIPGYTHAQLAEAALAGGVNWVQLRLKNKPYAICKEEAQNTLALCRQYGAKLIINDNVALAQEIGADGVHLGKQDMPTAQARKLLGPDFIIGGTANTFTDIQHHAAAGVNYIGLGPFRFTPTKENLSPVLGPEGYLNILKQCRKAGINIPIIAIGGLNLADIPALLASGVHGMAVSSAIAQSQNKTAAASQFVKALTAAFLLLEQ